MKKLKDTLAEQRRLDILRLLAVSGETGEGLIAAAIEAPQDLVRTELAWLAENGLVAITETGGVRFAAPTRRGSEAAAGVAMVPGVARFERRKR